MKGDTRPVAHGQDLFASRRVNAWIRSGSFASNFDRAKFNASCLQVSGNASLSLSSAPRKRVAKWYNDPMTVPGVRWFAVVLALTACGGRALLDGPSSNASSAGSSGAGVALGGAGSGGSGVGIGYPVMGLPNFGGADSGDAGPGDAGAGGPGSTDAGDVAQDGGTAGANVAADAGITAECPPPYTSGLDAYTAIEDLACAHTGDYCGNCKIDCYCEQAGDEDSARWRCKQSLSLCGVPK